MNKLSTLLGSIAVLACAGCVTSHPMTAEEFREAVRPGAFSAEMETFEVNRSFDDVAATFREKAPSCLSGRIKTTSQTNMSYQVIVTRYTPTVQVTPQRAEIHLQQHHEQGVMKISEEPENGYYMLVTDAYPIDGSRTRIEMFRPAFGYKHIIQAIKGWASGDNLGCPDLTKT
ncbi:MAG: hypothetical protein R3192_17690 [Woeseiaceae bacterium]|nr:hypothetical protein [Woeseiaceae bacterium]